VPHSAEHAYDSHAHGRTHGPALNERLGLFQILVRVLLPIIILVAGFAVMKVAGILRPAPKREVKTAGLPRVRTVKIEPWQDALTLDVDGSVVPFREVNAAV